uniref:EGF-like domain-containing protein n=1 Tax=Steinernema glaseri TaxID=37863 RepID=A0A1I8AAR8_9BILA
MVGWTKTALWLVATMALASALFPKILDGDDPQTVALKKAYQSWNASRKVNHDVFIENTARRTKRDVSQQPLGNVNSACQLPGYTGQHCEFPICTEVGRNFTAPQVDNEATLESGQATDLSPISFVVDETIKAFSVHLATSQPCSPSVVIKSLAGAVIPFADQTLQDDQSVTVYANVPAGTYYIVPSSVNPIEPGFLMMYQVRSKTTLQINAGFVLWDSANKQPERSDFPSYRVYQHEMAVAVVKPHGLERPGSLSTISFYKDDQLISRPMPLQIRYGCSFEYYFESFFCRDTGSYILK